MDSGRPEGPLERYLPSEYPLGLVESRRGAAGGVPASLCMCDIGDYGR